MEQILNYTLGKTYLPLWDISRGSTVPFEALWKILWESQPGKECYKCQHPWEVYLSTSETHIIWGTARNYVKSIDDAVLGDLVQIHEQQQVVIVPAGRRKAERRKFSSTVFPWVSSLPTSICQNPVSYPSVFSDQILNLFSMEQFFILFVY